jgi:hypothetical protein
VGWRRPREDGRGVGVRGGPGRRRRRLHQALLPLLPPPSRSSPAIWRQPGERASPPFLPPAPPLLN